MLNDHQGEDYSDIINLPHFKAYNHKPMRIYERAAQFAPFAAVSNHSNPRSSRENEILQQIKKKLDRKDPDSSN